MEQSIAEIAGRVAGMGAEVIVEVRERGELVATVYGADGSWAVWR